MLWVPPIIGNTTFLFWCEQKPIYLTRDEIEKRIKMNIPTAHKDKYLDLLYKFRSVISKDKSDLGMAKNFFHRIVLKDDGPVYRKQYKKEYCFGRLLQCSKVQTKNVLSYFMDL